MSCGNYFLTADGSLSLTMTFPVESLTEVKALFCFHNLDLDDETKKSLLPLVMPGLRELLKIFHYLELNPTWHTFDELGVEFGYTRNAMIKRCLRLQFGEFPIEIDGDSVRYQLVVRHL
jgi:hypothetical protein